MSRSARSVFIGVVLGAVALTAAALVAVAAGGERDALQQRIDRLDTRLVQQRAIARDLDRYRAEIERLAQRLKASSPRLHPDVAALARALEPDGVKLEPGAPGRRAAYDERPLTASGASEASLARALIVLEQSGHLVLLRRLEVTAEGWKADLLAFEAHEVAPLAPDLPPLPRRWFSGLNEARWGALTTKSEALAALVAQSGDVSTFSQQKKALEDLLGVLQAVEPKVPPTIPVLRSLWLGPAKILERGHLQGTASGLRGSGQLRVPLSLAEAQALLGAGVEVVTWRAEAQSVELELELLSSEVARPPPEQEAGGE